MRWGGRCLGVEAAGVLANSNSMQQNLAAAGPQHILHLPAASCLQLARPHPAPPTATAIALQAHRLARLQALGLEDDAKGAVAHHALRQVADDLLSSAGTAGSGDDVANIGGIALCSRG